MSNISRLVFSWCAKRWGAIPRDKCHWIKFKTFSSYISRFFFVVKLLRLCHKLAECISTAVYAFCWLIFWFVLCSFVSHFISIVHAMWHFRFLSPPHSRLQIGDDVSFFTQESTIEGFMACPLSTQQYGTALIQPAKNKRGEKDDGVKRKHFSFLLLFSSSSFFSFSLFFLLSSFFFSYLYCRVHFLHKQVKMSRATLETFSHVYFNSLLEKSSSVSGSWKSWLIPR